MNLADYDFSYLIPPKEVLEVKHDDYYIQHGEGEKSVRKIFDCVPYTPYEEQKLKEFEAMIVKEGIQLPQGWPRALTMKYVYSAKFALEKCMENLKVYLDWLSHPNRKTIPPKCLELLKEGLVYLSGRDKQFRPIIVVNVYRVDLKKMTIEDFTETLCALCSVIEKYCFVPGKVENWVFIIETGNMSLWSFPFTILQKLVVMTSIAFTSTMDKLFILNAPRLLKASWGMVQKILHPETAAKISMINSDEYAQLLEKAPADQLEEKYGGTLAPPDVYWPPRKTLNQPPYRQIGESIREIKVESLVIKGRESIRSQLIREQSSPGEKLVTSVYYDFDTVFIDGGDDEKLLRSANGKQNGLSTANESNGKTVTTLKSPGQYSDGDIILENNVVKPRCCKPRRSSDASSSCNIF